MQANGDRGIIIEFFINPNIFCVIQFCFITVNYFDLASLELL